LRKAVSEKIQSAVELEVKPKIDAQDGQRYILAELKRDIENIRDQFVDDYPVDLVLHKIAEVSW